MSDARAAALLAVALLAFAFAFASRARAQDAGVATIDAALADAGVPDAEPPVDAGVPDALPTPELADAGAVPLVLPPPPPPHVVETWSAPHHFEDGEGATSPWRTVPRRLEALPSGLVHGGVRVTGGVWTGNGGPTGYVDIAGTLELLANLVSEARFRLEVALGIAGVQTDTYGDRSGGGFYGAFRGFVVTTPEQTIFFRVGAEVLVQAVPATDHIVGRPGGAGIVELGGRMVDGHLEVGVSVAFGAVPVVDRYYVDDARLAFHFRLGLIVGWNA